MKRFVLPALVALCIFQALTQLFWLPISAHSGQTSIPWMMNHGGVLFGNLLEQHAPGGSVVSALAQKIIPLEPLLVDKLLNVVLVLASTVLVFAAAKRLANSDFAGIAAALVFAWWLPVYGNVYFYFNTILGFFVLAGMLILVSPPVSLRNYFFAGLLMGTATVFKQQGWAAAGIAGLWLLVFHRSVRGLALYIAGALILPVIVVGVIASQGNLANYIYWNWTFNLSGLMDGVPLEGNFFRKLLLSCIFIPPFALLLMRPGARWKEGILVLLLWAATAALLYPRFGEGQATGFLPLAAVMSGIVIANLADMWWSKPVTAANPSKKVFSFQFSAFSSVIRRASVSDLIVAGLMIAIGAGWLWTGAVTYVPTRLGIGGSPAYDEFRPLVAQLAPLQHEGDTLFVLPETDSTPQLHPMTGLMPPGLWIKGWHWYFDAPGIVDTLLAEWQTSPPTFIIVFPDLVSEGQPGIQPLMDVVAARYERVLVVDDIFLHGNAEVYKVKDSNE